jgi:hypothetical protein
MTETELDLVYEVKEKIEEAISALVNKILVKHRLTDEQDHLIRTQLTESYRFWK